MQAVPATLTLTDDYDTMVIRPASANGNDPVVCKQWDLGAPEVRVTSTPKPSMDGTIESAGYTGARTVTLDLQIFGDRDVSPYLYAERLAAFAHPARRPTLVMTRATEDTNGDEYTMAVRGNPFSISFGRRAAGMLEMQLVFTAPDGYLESPLRQFQSIAATDNADPGGVILPMSFAIGYGMDFGTGIGTNPAISFWINSSAPVAPLIAIHGPVTNPRLVTDTNEQFKFVGLTIAAGQMVVIDMEQATVRLDGSADASVYRFVDFTVSTFWRWPAYSNKGVRYMATSGAVTVQFYEKRLTL
jgi:hypothetical protein